VWQENLINSKRVCDDGRVRVYAMKDLKTVLLACVGVLVLAVLAAPVSGGLIIAEEGATVTSVTGATSPVIQVTDTSIPDGSTISIDVSTLRYYFESGSLDDTNIEVQTTAAAPVVWTPSVDPLGDTVYLISSGGDTLVGDNITVTFTGTASYPWISNSGYSTIDAMATRMDTYDMADIPIYLDTPAVAGGLSATDGAIVTTKTGSTSPVITILDTPIDEGGTITINVDSLGLLLTGDTVTDANVEVTSSAASPVAWTRSVSPDGKTLTLTSTGGATNPGDTVTVTFTGTMGNPWVSSSALLTLVPTRDDTGGMATFNVQIDIPAPGGLDASSGDEILTPTGATSPVLTITHAPIAQGGTVTIDISGINPSVNGGHLTNANVQVTDTAAAATWTRSVSGNTLTLTSTGGATAADETVTVTFTGAGGPPWVANTGSERIIPLTAVRQDTLETAGFNFMIDTGGRPVTDFSASPLSGVIPLDVVFTDLSSGSPNEWNWSFGDGTYSEQHNPSYTYTTSGLYTVSLNATNTRGSTIRSKADYIDVYTAGASQANSGITGLTLNTCQQGLRQRVQVDTSVLDSDLSPDNTVLIIRPPPDRGFSTVTLDALDGIGFTQVGDIVTGNITAVHFVSADIAPASGFSPDVGTNAAFNWSADLSYYPCNAIVSTSIRERITAENNNRLILIGNGNSPPAVPKGTAYSATITKINFPASVPVKIHGSVNPDWRTTLDPTSTVFIWRISDDGKTGQILPTQYLSTDPVNNLDFYEADSPLGMSTFGLSAFTGNNNPFQLITLAITEQVEPANNPPSQPNTAAGDSDTAQPAAAAATPAPTAAPQATPASPAPIVTATLYATQETPLPRASIPAPLPAEPNPATTPVSSAAPAGAMGIFSGLVGWVIGNPLILGVIFIFIILVVLYEEQYRRGW
jgi:PKD repeat protein